MLSKFSWHDYWLFIAACTAVYYVAVIALYFWDDIAQLLFGKIHPATPGRRTERDFYGPAQSGFSGPRLPELTGKADENTQNIVSTEQSAPGIAAHNGEVEENPESYELSEDDLQLIETVSEALAVAIGEYDARANKEELLLRIGHTISGIAPPQRLLPFRESLDWHIGQQLLLHTGLDPSESEMDRIWAIAEAGV